MSIKAIHLCVFVVLLWGCGEFADAPTTAHRQSMTCESLAANAEVTTLAQAATFAREACTTIDGDVYVTGSYDVGFASSVNEITGTLYIVDFSGPNLRLFEYLRSVGGLTVLRSDTSSISLPALEAAGAVRIEETEDNQVGFASLSSVDSLEIAKSADLATIDVPALRSANGRVRLYDLRSLTNLDMSSLQDVRGDFVIERVGLRTVNGLDSLRQVDGRLSVARNPELRDVGGFSSVTSVGDTVGFAQCPSLLEIDGFQNLEDHAGLLAMVDMENLRLIGGVQNLRTLETLELARLSVVDPGDGFANLTELETLHLDSLETSWEFAELRIEAPLSKVLVAGTEFPNLTGMTLATDADITLVLNSSLTGISTVEVPRFMGRVQALGNGFSSFGWQSVGTIKTMTLRESPALRTLDFPSLTRIDNELNLRDLSGLGDDLGVDLLQSVGEDLDIFNCSSLTTLRFPALRLIEDDFIVKFNDELVDLSQVDLDRVVDEVIFEQNSSLASCEVDDFVSRIEDGPSAVTNTGNDGAGPCN